MRLGVRHAAVEQPRVEVVVALAPQPRRDEALAHQPHLILHLPLLPAGGGGAGDRVDQVVAAHLEEAPIVDALGADADRLHRLVWSGSVASPAFNTSTFVAKLG